MRRRLLIGLGANADRIAHHQRRDRRLRPGQDEVAQRQHPEQVLLGIDDIGVVQGFGLLGDAAQGGNRVIGPQVGRNRHEGRGHQPAGALRRKGEQLPDLGGLGRFHLDQDLLGFGPGQLLDDVGGVVGVHRLQEIGGDGLAEGAQDGRGVCRLQLGQQLRHLRIGQPLDEDRQLVGVEARHQLRPLGRANPAGETADAFPLPGGDQLPHIVEQRGVGHGVISFASSGARKEREGTKNPRHQAREQAVDPRWDYSR